MKDNETKTEMESESEEGLVREWNERGEKKTEQGFRDQG